MINVEELAASDRYVAAVLQVAVANYREYQHEYGKAVASGGRYPYSSPSVIGARRADEGALEALIAVVMVATGAARDTAYAVSRGRLLETCGTADHPTGLAEWMQPH